MKSPADYIDVAVAAHNTNPSKTPYSTLGRRVVPYEAAQQAIAAALADAEREKQAAVAQVHRYHYLLARAVRHAKFSPPTPQTTPAHVPS